jgi:hypothetical protein
MSESAPVPRGLCFHEFELDLKSGKLDTDGREFAFASEAPNLLWALVERPAGVVMRDYQSHDSDHGLEHVGGWVRGS